MRSSETPEERFTRLYQETRVDVLTYLVHRSRSMEDATDALAETYAAAWRKFEELPTGNKARLWLFGAAHNELRMTERRHERGAAVTLELAAQLRLSNSEHPQTGDTSSAIQEALAKLSRVDYEIVTLTAWEELAPREIGVVLGISANVVRIRLHRARVALRRFLQEQQPHHDSQGFPKCAHSPH